MKKYIDFSPKITTTFYINKGCLRFSYFEYFQIWLNSFMDDCHLNNITKLRIFFFLNYTYTNVFFIGTSLILNFKEYWNLFIKPKSWWRHFSFCERTFKFDISCFYYVVKHWFPKICVFKFDLFKELSIYNIWKGLVHNGVSLS
jgi:hypothetical protein